MVKSGGRPKARGDGPGSLTRPSPLDSSGAAQPYFDGCRIEAGKPLVRTSSFAGHATSTDNRYRRHDMQKNGELRPAASGATGSIGPYLVAGGLFGVVAAIAVLLELFVAHRLPPLTEETLSAAEKKWDATKPASYNLDLEIRGAEPGPVHLEVRNGEVVAMQRNGITPDQRRVWDVWTVPGQFEMLEREMELAADPVHQMDATAGTRLTLQCEFDPHYGYPQQYHRLVYGGGPEVYWRTVKFKPQ
jgi:Family of unknown function (DUF6174)